MNLTGAHLVIPAAVVKELSGFKRERSERGKAALEVLKRLRALSERNNSDFGLSDEFLDDPNYESWTDYEIRPGQMLSISPAGYILQDDAYFQLKNADMDEQVILAVITIDWLVEMTDHFCSTDNGQSKNDCVERNVILLTKNNERAVLAGVYGVKTARFGYELPQPYTGRREVVVPKRLFEIFYESRGVSQEFFAKTLPNQPPLVANEFVIFSLEDASEYPRDFRPEEFQHVGRYDYGLGAIVGLKYIESFPVPVKNVGQAIYAEALMNPTIAAVICTGPAGSGKTFMSTVYGYAACQAGQFIGVTVVPCEASSRIGALPGGLNEKMDPEVQPFKNALRNYLLNEDSEYRRELKALRKFGASCKRSSRGDDSCEKKASSRSLKNRLEDHVELIWSNWFTNIPIENARGRDFAYEIALYDEFQDQNVAQADTLIKRIGQHGKIILTGDINQIHAPYLDAGNNGITYATRQLYDNSMVAQVCFTEEEVVRHPLVQAIAERQRAERIAQQRYDN